MEKLEVNPQGLTFIIEKRKTMFSYIAIDIVCMLIILLVLWKVNRHLSDFKERGLFNASIISSMTLFASDAIFMAFGETAINIRTIAYYVTNAVYMANCAFLGFIWFLFVLERLELLPKKGWKKYFLYFVSAIPALVLLYFSISARFDSLLFYVTSEGVYVRGPAHFIQPLVDGLYLFASSVINIIFAIKAKNGYERKELFTYAGFVIFPALGMVLQVLVPEIPFSSFGMALSYLILYFFLEENRFMRDEMTGLYNKNQMEKILSAFIHEPDSRKKKRSFYLVMMDLDYFKTINDTFGHLVGDEAIQETSACINQKDVFYRYYYAGRFGGDEFILFCSAKDEADFLKIIGAIDARIQLSNKKRGKKSYKLSLSKGYTKVESGDASFQEVIDRADDELYAAKKRRPGAPK